MKKSVLKLVSVILTALILASSLPLQTVFLAAEITVETAGDKNYIPGDVIYENNFDNETLDTLPDGWQASGKSWGWGTGSGYAKITEHSTEGKVLTYSASSLDYWISMPEIGTRNYIFEASFIVDSGTTSGSLGIANGMYGGITNATGAVYTALYVQKLDGCYYRSKGTPSVQTVNFTRPSKNIMVNPFKMKFVCLDGINYLYIDDTFIAALPQGESKSASDWAGFYSSSGTYHITNVTVTEITDTALKTDNVALNTDGENISLSADFSFNKSSSLYRDNIPEGYTYAGNTAFKAGVLTFVSDTLLTSDIKKGDSGVTDTLFDYATEDYAKLYFKHNISVGSNIDKFFILRPYILVGDNYFYSDSVSYCPAKLANLIYSSSDAEAREKLQTAFKDSSVFKGENAKSITFTLFSDFHYKENMYITSIADLRSILKRAEDSNSEFIISGGDFCNDIAGSPELINTYLGFRKADGTTLDAYNIYGNHELETSGNSMDNVTATLTNDKNVVWGTENGEFDSNIGYYYFDNSGFRIVCVDTNYSYDTENTVWEHNEPASYGAPSGNTKANSLGPTQLTWLENVLTDAANNSIPCIVISHDGFSGKFATSSADAEAVREIYARVNAIRAGTVIMSVNGHHHTNNQGYNDGVFYFDMNTTRNGYWKQMTEGSRHYASTDTYMYEKYDDEGNLLDSYERPINELYQSQNSWFFADPLSAVVTVDEFGTVTVDGMESSWLYDLAPNATGMGLEPRVTSGRFWDCESLGHIWSDDYNQNETHHWQICENKACPTANISLNKGYALHDFAEVEAEEYLIPGTTSLYYKSCFCGAVSDEYFGEGVLPAEIWDGTVADSFADGSGSSADPYIIETPSQLARMVAIGDTTGGYYKITKDIYLNDINNADWKNDSPNSWFDRAYINNTAFVGNIDGTGHTIHGLYYNGSSIFGLLPQANNTTIQNLRISNSDITSTAAISALVAFGQGTVKFTNCQVDETVNITGSGDTAGYIAYGYPSIVIENSSSTANIDGAKNVGAFIGDCWWASGVTHKISNSFAVDQPLGGKLGFTATNCYNSVAETMSVTGNVVNLGDKNLMQGENALNNMPLLGGFVPTEGYPTRFYNGKEGKVWSGAVAVDFASGEGTAQKPYIIKTPEQLAKILSGETDGNYYALGADICLNDMENPVNNWFNSDNSAVFKGTLDGKNYIISGLYYNQTVTSGIKTALIPVASGAKVKNVILTDSELTLKTNSSSATYIGGIYGFLTGTSSVTDCYIADSVKLSNTVCDGVTTVKTVVGGIIAGANCPLTVNSCAFFGEIECSPYRFGAVIGDTYTATADTRIVTDTITTGCTPSSKWGFAGENNISTIAPADGTDTNASFTVTDSLTGEDGLKAIEPLNSQGKYFGTETYPALTVLARRFKDVNGDLKTDSVDLALLRNRLLCKTALGYGDINLDSKNNLKDLVNLKKILADS